MPSAVPIGILRHVFGGQPVFQQPVFRRLRHPYRRGNKAVFPQTDGLCIGDDDVIQHRDAQRLQRVDRIPRAIDIRLRGAKRAAGMIVRIP